MSLDNHRNRSYQFDFLLTSQIAHSTDVTIFFTFFKDTCGLASILKKTK